MVKIVYWYEQGDKVRIVKNLNKLIQAAKKDLSSATDDGYINYLKEQISLLSSLKVGDVVEVAQDQDDDTFIFITSGVLKTVIEISYVKPVNKPK